MGPFAHSAFRSDLDPRVAHSMRLRADRRAYCGAPANHNDASATYVLATRFPVIRRMVGDESFRVMAQRYVLSEPPCLPSPQSYGESFPRFLRSQDRLASMGYVADIAELEVACRKAEHAADARCIDAKRSLAWQAEHADSVCVILHPSVHLVASRFPIVTLWKNNRNKSGNCAIERWRPEDALVTRPFQQVEIRSLPAGGHTFIAALAGGQTVAKAASTAMDATPEFDSAASLTMLADANAVIGIRQHVCNVEPSWKGPVERANLARAMCCSCRGILRVLE
jgi:hypothetical protein